MCRGVEGLRRELIGLRAIGCAVVGDEFLVFGKYVFADEPRAADEQAVGRRPLRFRAPSAN